MTGPRSEEPVLIDAKRPRWLAYADTGEGARRIDRDEVPALLQREDALLWLDLLAPTEEDVEWLREHLNFHPLALEDLLVNRIRPRQEEYGEVLFTAFRAINLNPGADQLDTINLNLFLTRRFLVTTHMGPLLSVQRAVERIDKAPDTLRQGVDMLYYRLLDGLVDRYLDLAEQIEQIIEALEDRLFEDNGQEDLQQDIFDQKKGVTRLRRLVVPGRDALAALLRERYAQIQEKTETHLRDVLDNVMRVQDLLESYQDLLSGLRDSYMSQISNRMNDVMKLLSIIATLMLPLGFLTGLFGMNFVAMPLIENPRGFWYLAAAMAATVVAMLFLFRRKRML